MEPTHMILFAALGGLAGALISHTDWLIAITTNENTSSSTFTTETRWIIFAMRMVRGLFVGVAFCLVHEYYVGFEQLPEKKTIGVLGVSFISSMFTNIASKHLNPTG